MCLSGANSTEGTQLEQATCNSTTLQEWDVTSAGRRSGIATASTMASSATTC